MDNALLDQILKLPPARRWALAMELERDAFMLRLSVQSDRVIDEVLRGQRRRMKGRSTRRAREVQSTLRQPSRPGRGHKDTPTD